VEFKRVFDLPVPHTVAGRGFGSLTLDVDGFLESQNTTNPTVDDAVGEDWLEYLRDVALEAKAQLEQKIAHSKDPYLMKSLMQKGVRRRDWQAAATGAYALIAMGKRQDAVRRLHVIAMEDIGNGDPEAAALGQMILQSTGVRKEFGDVETLLMATRVLTMAWKSRDCTDLVLWPEYQTVTLDERWPLVKGFTPTQLQSTALCPGLMLSARIHSMMHLSNEAKIEVAREMKCSPSTIYASEISAKKTGFSFRHVAPFAALMTRRPQIRGDWYPTFADKVHGILSAAYDRYTSKGKSAIRVFSVLAEVKKWFADHPHVDRAEAILEAVFYVEGGLITPRVMYENSMDLYWSTLEAMTKKHGFHSLDEALELYDLVLQFLPRLNRLRFSTGTDRPHDKGVL
jgi:hypothetical protein